MGLLAICLLIGLISYSVGVLVERERLINLTIKYERLLRAATRSLTRLGVDPMKEIERELNGET